MINTTSGNKRLWALIPLCGTVSFIFLYYIAAFLYPGGSQADQLSKGFSWLNNYWCDLLHDTAQNGMNNSAKPFAIIAMIILCISLSVFWYIVPYNLSSNKSTQLVIQCSGIASMITAVFLFTSYHDVVINISSALALVAMIITIQVLFRKKMFILFGLGILCLLFCAVNNYVYYTTHLIVYLPVVQKISFIVFLSWFSLLAWRIYRLK